MKKLFVLILTLCLMATVFCVTSFAADEPAADTVLRVNGIKENGDIAKVEDYKVFDDGWNAAMDLATSRSKMREKGFIRVEVVLYKDWIADNGEFTDEWDNGPGFNWDAIYFKDDVRITLDLNGHTVDRGLTKAELNGEVMYIEEDADIVIKNGTIKGGFSNNGAGGIQVEGGSKLLLQNVNVINNSVEDDNGAAIALYDGAKLTMIGGSIKNNSVIFDGDDTTRGTVYVEESTAIFNEVTFSGNEGRSGAVIYAGDSTVTLNDCIVENNERNDVNDNFNSSSLFYTNSTAFSINGGEIKNNGSASKASIFFLDGTFNMTECEIKDNNTDSIFCENNGGAMECVYYISNCKFTGNDGLITVKYTSPNSNRDYDVVFNFVNCEFNNNDANRKYGYSFYADPYVDISLIDCKIGNTTFCNKQYIDFGRGEGVGSMFGEGSLALIVAFVALVASIAAIVVNVYNNKNKKPALATDNGDEESDDEE